MNNNDGCGLGFVLLILFIVFVHSFGWLISIIAISILIMLGILIDELQKANKHLENINQSLNKISYKLGVR